MQRPEAPLPDDDRCPYCDTIGDEILWGLPNFEYLDAHPRKRVALGGCCVNEDAEKYACPQCGLRWGIYNFGHGGHRRRRYRL